MGFSLAQNIWKLAYRAWMQLLSLWLPSLPTNHSHMILTWNSRENRKRKGKENGQLGNGFNEDIPHGTPVVWSCYLHEVEWFQWRTLPLHFMHSIGVKPQLGPNPTAEGKRKRKHWNSINCCKHFTRYRQEPKQRKHRKEGTKSRNIKF